MREQILQRHLDAENAGDVDAIMATYVDEPVIVLNGRELRGRERVRAFHERFGFGGAGGSFAEVRVLERARHATEAAIAIEQTLCGRHVAEWEGLAPTDRRFELAVCTVYRFAPDGRLASEDVYLDRARLRELLTR